MVDESNIGFLNIYAAVPKLVLEFLNLMVEARPALKSILGISGAYFEDLPDDERIGLRIDSSMIPIFQSVFLLSRNSKTLDDKRRKMVAQYIAKQWPVPKRKAGEARTAQAEMRVELDFRNFFGALYTCLLVCAAKNRGLDFHFVPEAKHGKRPDLYNDQLKVLVEAKDSLSIHGIDRDRDGLIRKLRDLIIDAESHFTDLDPKGEYLHDICIDLPEGASTLLVNMMEADKRSIFTDLFGLSRLNINGDLVPGNLLIDQPGRVFLSDFDVGIYSPKKGPDWPKEPQWVKTWFFGPVNSRIEDFRKIWFDSQTTDL